MSADYKYKLCVYAICKNESQFIDRWVDSMSEADCICVLDTGSTDDSFLKLKSRGVYVEQKIFEPFCFDSARNESLKLIPNWCDLAIWVDLDEYFKPGWRTTLESNFWGLMMDVKRSDPIEDFSGKPLKRRDSICCRRIHRVNYNNSKLKFINPIHEGLVDLNNLNCKSSLIEGLRLIHTPDYSKSRIFYKDLKILKERASIEDALKHEDNLKIYFMGIRNFIDDYINPIDSNCDLFKEYKNIICDRLLKLKPEYPFAIYLLCLLNFLETKQIPKDLSFELYKRSPIWYSRFILIMWIWNDKNLQRRNSRYREIYQLLTNKEPSLLEISRIQNFIEV